MEDKNQSSVTEPVQSQSQEPSNQGMGTNNTTNANSATDEKEGLEQEGSIKNSK
jgi:hypothetical protein